MKLITSFTVLGSGMDLITSTLSISGSYLGQILSICFQGTDILAILAITHTFLVDHTWSENTWNVLQGFSRTPIYCQYRLLQNLIYPSWLTLGVGGC